MSSSCSQISFFYGRSNNSHLISGIIGDLTVGGMFAEAQEADVQDTEETGDDKKKKKYTGPSKEQMEKMQGQQRERVKKLTENLIHKLSLYTDSQTDDEHQLRPLRNKSRLKQKS